MARPGRPREFDEARALDRAMRLFWERGYEATSIQALTAAMEITPPQLYAAFGNKEKLFEAAVDLYAATAGAFAGAALEKGRTARQAIELLLMGAAEVFTRPGLPPGCMVVLAATNCSSDAVDEMMRLRRLVSENAIADRLRRGIRDGEMARNVRVPELAKFFAGVFQGMAIQARDGASRESLEAMARLAIEAWPD